MLICRFSLRLALLGAIASLALPFFAAPASAAIQLPPRMGAIGDSLTRAFGAGGAPTDSTRYSFATGNDVLSHAGRLAAMDDAIGAFNLAKTGTKIAKLVEKKNAPDGTPIPNQIDQLFRDTEYVTVTIGSADLCQGLAPTGVGTFRKKAIAMMTQLHERLGVANIVILPVPNWVEVWRDNSDDPTVVARWEAVETCPMIFGADATDEGRAEAETMILTYNELLASACAESNTRRFNCFYASRVFDIQWAADDLSSYDGFHPSPAGQQKLSNASWRVSPYRLAKWGVRYNKQPFFSRPNKTLRLNFETAPHASVTVRVRSKSGALLGQALFEANDNGVVVGKVNVPGWHGQNVVKVIFTLRLNDEVDSVKRKLRV